MKAGKICSLFFILGRQLLFVQLVTEDETRSNIKRENGQTCKIADGKGKRREWYCDNSGEIAG
jgi:hypothetical protein